MVSPKPHDGWDCGCESYYLLILVIHYFNNSILLFAVL